MNSVLFYLPPAEFSFSFFLLLHCSIHEGNEAHLIQHLVGCHSLINQEPLENWQVSLKKGQESEGEEQGLGFKCMPLHGTETHRPKENLQMQSMSSLSQILAADFPKGTSNLPSIATSAYPKGIPAAPSVRKSASAGKISVLYGTPPQQPKDKMSLTR